MGIYGYYLCMLVEWCIWQVCLLSTRVCMNVSSSRVENFVFVIFIKINISKGNAKKIFLSEIIDVSV